MVQREWLINECHGQRGGTAGNVNVLVSKSYAVSACINSGLAGINDSVRELRSVT